MTVHRKPTGPPTSLRELVDALLLERFGTTVPEWHPPTPSFDEARALRLIHQQEKEAAS